MPFLPLIFCLFLGASQAALYSLRDQRPGLAVTGQAEALEWWEGGPAFALASAGALRLNFRGLHVYPAKAALRPLDGWHAAACNASAWALCAADVGQVLPYASPRVPERQEDGWNDLACADARGKLLVTQGVYDISACDVFDEGLDLVFAGNVLYHRHSTLELWEYWLLVVLAIVLVRFLSHNIQALWDPAPDPRPQLPALICVLLVLAVVLVDGDHHFVTSADQVRAPILAPSGGVSSSFFWVCSRCSSGPRSATWPSTWSCTCTPGRPRNRPSRSTTCSWPRSSSSRPGSTRPPRPPTTSSSSACWPRGAGPF